MIFYIILEWITNWLCKKSQQPIEMTGAEIEQSRQAAIDNGMSPEEADDWIQKMRDDGYLSDKEDKQ